MTYLIDIQHACQMQIPFSDDMLISWIKKALESQCQTGELTLRLVDPEEIMALNASYRQKKKPTNILSFPSQLPKNIPLEYPLLGDMIVCPEVLASESQSFGTPLDAHWAHILIHGVLHLFGYDHIQTEDAVVMQTLEIQLLDQFGFTNPYHAEGSSL